MDKKYKSKLLLFQEMLITNNTFKIKSVTFILLLNMLNENFAHCNLSHKEKNHYKIFLFKSRMYVSLHHLNFY